MKSVQETCARYNIPLIMDEIQSGLGRTGKRWACEHFGMKPDMITASKGLRQAATIGKRSMFPKEPGRLGGTWAEGNAIATAVGYTCLDIIDRENLVANAERQGKYLRKRLLELPSKKFSRAFCRFLPRIPAQDEIASTSAVHAMLKER